MSRSCGDFEETCCCAEGIREELKDLIGAELQLRQKFIINTENGILRDIKEQVVRLEDSVTGNDTFFSICDIAVIKVLEPAPPDS